MNYEKEAIRSNTYETFGKKVPMSNFVYIMRNVIRVSEIADETKKKFFYGKGEDSTLTMKSEFLIEDFAKAAEISIEDATDYIHGIVGLISELGELVEMLGIFISEPFSEKFKFDKVNNIEECGDLLWYINLILKASDSNFNEAMQKNINKLKLRYPEKFTLDACENRDVEAERELLQQKFSDYKNGIDEKFESETLENTTKFIDRK